MKTIILSTDFSSEAENAILYTAEAAVGKNYKLVLYHLYKPSIHALNARLSSDDLDQMRAKRAIQLKERAQFLQDTYQVQTSSHMASGDFQEELAFCIEKYQADLVVMGMPEKSLEQDLLGNTTTTAINNLKFPILSIPKAASFKGIKHILFASDLVRGVHRQILDKVISFAKDFDANVEVFNVRDKEEAALQTHHEHQIIDESLSEIDHSFKSVYATEIIKAIKKEIELSNTDLLVMVPYKYGFWNSLLHKSKTKVMASGNKVPLLSLPI